MYVMLKGKLFKFSIKRISNTIQTDPVKFHKFAKNMFGVNLPNNLTIMTLFCCKQFNSDVKFFSNQKRLLIVTFVTHDLWCKKSVPILQYCTFYSTYTEYRYTISVNSCCAVSYFYFFFLCRISRYGTKYIYKRDSGVRFLTLFLIKN